MTHRCRHGGLVLLVACCALVLGLSVNPLTATRVRPVNLEEMTRRADRIFSGRCLEVAVEQDTELKRDVTRVTFEVSRAVKGSLSGQVTVKMLGAASGLDASGTREVGMPRFEPGEQVILFLYGDNARGLTSPVGLGQGKFRVFEDKHGRQTALSLTGNEALFRDLSSDARERIGPELPPLATRDGIEAGKLLDLVEALQR